MREIKTRENGEQLFLLTKYLAGNNHCGSIANCSIENCSLSPYICRPTSRRNLLAPTFNHPKIIRSSSHILLSNYFTRARHG